MPVLKLQLGALPLIAGATLFAIATYVAFAERVKWSWFLALISQSGGATTWLMGRNGEKVRTGLFRKLR